MGSVGVLVNKNRGFVGAHDLDGDGYGSEKIERTVDLEGLLVYVMDR